MNEMRGQPRRAAGSASSTAAAGHARAAMAGEVRSNKPFGMILVLALDYEDVRYVDKATVTHILVGLVLGRIRACCC
jgi:hypothetical protein